MNTDHLLTFQEVAQCGNFTLAAQHLFVSQSTVSDRIRELEAEVGKPLFNRSRRGSTLTPAGEVLYEYASKMLALTTDLQSNLSTLDTYSETLKLSSSTLLFDMYVGDGLEEFMIENPDVAIRLSLNESDVIVQNLHVNTPDVAFTYTPIHDSDYICKQFRRTRVILATSADNREFEAGIYYNELFTQPIIHTDTFSAGNRWILPDSHTYRLRTSYTSHILDYLTKGYGYAFIFEDHARRYIDEGRIIEIPILDIDIPNEYSYIVYRAPLLNSLAFRKLYRTFMD